MKSSQPISWSDKLTEMFIFGPILFILFLGLLPIGISGNSCYCHFFLFIIVVISIFTFFRFFLVGFCLHHV